MGRSTGYRAVGILITAAAVALESLTASTAAPLQPTHASKAPKVVHRAVELTAPDGAVDDALGVSVAISGDTIVTGAFNHDDGAGPGEGAAYVFVKPKGGWAKAKKPVAELTPSDGASGDLFGTSVAISGNTIVVGSTFHATGGALYVFVEPKSGWTTAHETAELTVPASASFDALGAAVAISGNAIVGGQPNHQVGTRSAAGVVYLYLKPKSGWASTESPNASFVAAGGRAHDRFGAGLAFSGSTLVVGASQHQVGSSADEGEAYVFAKPAHGWSGSLHQNAVLRARDGTTDTGFGVSLSIAGSTIVVGAGSDPYVFAKPKGGWSGTHHESAELTYPGVVPSDEFGLSVAISGKNIVTCMPFQQLGANADEGAAYRYTRPGSVWKSSAHPGLELTAKAGVVGEHVGAAVATSSGLIVAGATGATVGGNTDQGALEIFAAPTATLVQQSHKSWKRGSKLPLVNPSHVPKAGTVFALNLDQRGKVELSFTRKGAGHAGTITRTMPAGHDRLFFDGRLTHAKKLLPGHYAVTISATDSIGRSARKVLHFTVRH